MNIKNPIAAIWINCETCATDHQLPYMELSEGLTDQEVSEKLSTLECPLCGRVCPVQFVEFEL